MVSADLARSRYDVNTLSTKDKGNDAGNAVKITLKNLHMISERLPGWVISSYLNYEYNDIRFQPLEPIRSVEFLRDWGLPLQMPKANETFYKAAFQTHGSSQTMKFTMRLAGYNRNTDFTGVRKPARSYTECKRLAFQRSAQLYGGPGHHQQRIFIPSDGRYFEDTEKNGRLYCGY